MRWKYQNYKIQDFIVYLIQLMQEILIIAKILSIVEEQKYGKDCSMGTIISYYQYFLQQLKLLHHRILYFMFF